MNKRYNQLGKIFLGETKKGEGPGEQGRRPGQTAAGYRSQRGAEAPRRAVPPGTTTTTRAQSQEAMAADKDHPAYRKRKGRTAPTRSKEAQAIIKRKRDLGREARRRTKVSNEPSVASVHGHGVRRYLSGKSERVPSEAAIRAFRRRYGRMPGHRVAEQAYRRLAYAMLEVSPPGWGHTKTGGKKSIKVGGTAAAMKKAKAEGRMPGVKNIFSLMWSMKNKGDKPHYKPGKKGVLKKKYKKKKKKKKK